MSYEASYTETKRICLSNKEATRITIEVLCRKYQLRRDYEIRDGRFVTWLDTGHGSGMTQKHREVTEQDKIIFDIIKELEDDLCN